MDHMKFTSRRSILAVPGSSEKMLEKSRTIAADEVFLDLEDSVTSELKVRARELVANMLITRKHIAPLLSVRVNEQVNEFGRADIDYLLSHAGGTFDSIIVPKIESAEQVRDLDARLTSLEKINTLVLGSTKLQIQIESAKGLASVFEIASSSSRMISLTFGPGDFAASIGMQVLHLGENPIGYPGEDAYHYVLMQILVAARVNGLLAIDGPYSGIENTAGLIKRAMISSALGFDGKWAIHPSQIGPINDAFTPSQETFQEAKRLIDNLEMSESSDKKGAVVFDGKMIDNASRKMAEMIVARGIAAGLISKTNNRNN
jgi:citrate lyase subunit beta/citryl-CoA lyase